MTGEHDTQLKPAIEDRIQDFLDASVVAEDLYNNRNKLITTLGESVENGYELVAPSGQVFSITHSRGDGAGFTLYDQLSFQRWDPEHRRGMDGIVEKDEEFFAGKLDINLETGEFWAVSPDEETCFELNQFSEIQPINSGESAKLY